MLAKITSAVCLLALIDVAAPCLAQTPSKAGDIRLEEVIVTAQKRGENVQDVPISISAFTGENLETQGITNTQQLQFVTSGLVFSTFNQAAQPYVRGIGTDQNTTDSESAVGLYVDGVYVANIYRNIQEFSDVERVEVLKGPQGTLYGRNTTGGAINVITRTPTQEFRADGSLELGTNETVKVKAYVSGGTEKVAASLALFRASHEGYQKNLFDGDHLDETNLTAARGKVKYTFDDIWQATLSAQVSSDHGSAGCCFSYISPHPLPELLGGKFSLHADKVVNNLDTFTNADDLGASLNVRADYPSFSFVSITGWTDFKRYGSVDVDSSDLPIANSESLPQTNKSWSQEFQVLSPADANVQWIIGAFGFQARGAFDPLVGGNDVDIATFTNTFAASRARAAALFGQLTYPLTDAWSVTGGVRYNWDKKEVTRSELFIPATGERTFFPEPSKSWEKFLPKLTVQYDIGDNMYYATASKGFRSGAFNLTAPGSEVVDPENITAFEVGGKHNLPGNWLQVNWSAYHYKYKDLQVVSVEGDASVNSTLQNAASEKSYGLDLDFGATPVEGFESHLALSYLHARYDSFPNASATEFNSTLGFGNRSIIADASGNIAPRAPKVSGSLNLSYTRPVGFADLGLNATYYATDKVYYDPTERVSQDAYGLLNLRSELRFKDKGVTVGVFADNVTDKRAITGVVETVIGDIAQFTPPRTLGVFFKASYE